MTNSRQLFLYSALQALNQSKEEPVNLHNLEWLDNGNKGLNGNIIIFFLNSSFFPYLFIYFIYLFINYNTITNYILIIYEQSNFDHLLGVVSQTRVSGGNRTHDPHTNSVAHYLLDYQGTLFIALFQFYVIKVFKFQNNRVASCYCLLAMLSLKVAYRIDFLRNSFAKVPQKKSTFH